MELSIKERMMLSAMMPENSGSLAERRAIRELVKLLTPSKEELDEIEFKQVKNDNGEYFTWKSEKEKPLTFNPDETTKNVLKEILKDVESEKKVNDENFDLLEKIEML